MSGRIISLVCTILAVVGIVVLAFGYKDYSSDQGEISAVYAELSAKLSKLESEKRDVQSKILRLEESVAESSDSVATLNIIFTDMSEVIYTEILPVMKEYGFKGTLAVSAKELPGKNGLLTERQIGELVGDGWDVIPRYIEGDGVIGIGASSEWIARHGYDAKATVMIDEDKLTPEVEKAIAQAGYTSILVKLGDGTDGVVVNDITDGAWRPKAVGYLSQDRRGILTDAVQAKGHVAFVVGFDKDNTSDLYGAKVLSSMLGYLGSLCDNGELECLGIYDAMVYRTDAELRQSQAEAESQTQMDEYKAKLAQIDKALADLYKNYK